MSVVTHCLPNTDLGTAELPVPNVNATNTQVLTPSGSKRGIAVNVHGMITFNPTSVMPQMTDVGGFLPSMELTLGNDLKSDGWVVMYPTYPGDNFAGIPALGIYNDIAADSGHGSRYLAAALHWWDHLVEYIHTSYGNWPIIVFGFSLGGWYAFQIAANRSSDLTGYISHHAATVLSQANPVWTTPANFSSLNTSGFDTSLTILNNVTSVPGMIGWGTADSAVGYTNIQTIYNNALNAGCPVNSNPTSNEHMLTTTDDNTYLSWVTSTIDPLAPAIH